MRHHQYNPSFSFYMDPMDFDKHTERRLLQYCLGATMYMPGTKNFVSSIVNKKWPGLTSMVMCFEDACPEDEVPAAELNVIEFLNLVLDALNTKKINYSDVPLIFFRVRNHQQFEHFISLLCPEQADLICGINFPKFNTHNGALYFEQLKMLNRKMGQKIYGMPILEDSSIAFKEFRMDELIGIKKILDLNNEFVLNVRVGGTDFSSCFGVRRDVDYTIYDIMTVKDCLADILNVFARNNDYTVSGPVWEYFRASKHMKFEEELPRSGLQNTLLKRRPVVNDVVDGLMRELILDRANGFIGKTCIHPTHLNYINGMLAVTREEYEDSFQILHSSGGVVKGSKGMNEIGPHYSWADRIARRAAVFGVIEDEDSYLDLFESSCE